jgi:hypothetical protein
VIKDRAVALQIDFEGRKRPAPIGSNPRHALRWSDEAR